MHNKLIVLVTFALTLAACAAEPEVGYVEVPGDVVVVTETNTEYVEIDKETDQTPTLQIGFSWTNANQGHWTFAPGERRNMGGVHLKASESMTVETVTLKGYVNDTPGTFGITGWYSVKEKNGIRFADHFTNCTLGDHYTGDLLGGPIDPDSNGLLTFNQPFLTGDAHYHTMVVMCEHTGITSDTPIGFAMDIAYGPTEIMAVTQNGYEPVVSVGNRNGLNSPSYALILTEN